MNKNIDLKSTKLINTYPVEKTLFLRLFQEANCPASAVGVVLLTPMTTNKSAGKFK